MDGDVRIDYSQPLPFPFPTRPRLGARMYVRGQIKRFLKPLLKELGESHYGDLLHNSHECSSLFRLRPGDWMSTAKTRAISLLMDVLVYCEEHITQEAHDIVPVLIKLYSSGDNVEAVNNAATLFGRFVQPEVYLPLLVPYVEGDVVLAGETSDLLSRAFALKLLARFLAGESTFARDKAFTALHPCLPGPGADQPQSRPHCSLTSPPLPQPSQRKKRYWNQCH